MAFNEMTQSIWQLQAQYFGPWFDAYLLILARVLGFVTQAPITGRKDVIFEAKLGLGILISLMLVMSLPQATLAITPSSEIGTFTLTLLLNAVIGALLGFLVNLTFETINAAGGFITAQIGLQAANIMDPNSKQQTALLTPLFGLFGILLFLDLGGAFWLMKGLQRSFELFPIGLPTLDWQQQIPFERVLDLSNNVFKVGLLLAAPFFVVTMLVDIMLGIVNRAAQQIPVFQLSFGLKPAIGVFVFWLTLKPLTILMQNFLSDYANLF